MLDWFIPQTIDLVDSKFNGRIKVVKEYGHINVIAGGYQQSGDLIDRIWRKALTTGLKDVDCQKIKRILVLGLGTGTVLPVIYDLFPNNDKIVGVEIDEAMVKIGRKHFSLDKNKNLQIEIGDASVFVDKLKDKFDLILVDTYKGNIFSIENFPQFLKSLDGLKNDKGLTVINFLDFKSNLTQAQLLHLLGREAKIIKADYNWFAFV